MVKCIVNMLSHKGGLTQLCIEASDVLVKMLLHDPNVDVRLAAIHQVCDLAYHQKTSRDHPTSGESATSLSSGSFVSSKVLRAVGNRVSSKHKSERRDAVSGLVQIYFRQYVCVKLRDVQSGGDDCDIGAILKVLRDTCGGILSLSSGGGGGSGGGGRSGSPTAATVRVGGGRLATPGKRTRKNQHHRPITAAAGDPFNPSDDDSGDMEEKYRWIPQILFESACFTDEMDPEMRNRVIQMVDDDLMFPRARVCSLLEH